MKGRKKYTKECSKIQFSVISELVCLGEDSLDNMAFCFGKHSKDVCKRFCIQFYSTRKAARMSWKCHNMYNSENEKKAADLRDRILENKSCPEVEDIESWIAKRINLLKLAGTEVDNPELMEVVKILKDKLHFHIANF